MITYWFDMDGTIADFYSVDGWLNCLINEDVTPYLECKPLVRMSALAKKLNNLQKNGNHIGIISWGSKNASNKFLNEIIEAKKEWLHHHLPSVTFDEIHIVAYGTPKTNFRLNENDVLFDDELPNREAWGELSFAAI